MRSYASAASPPKQVRVRFLVGETLARFREHGGRLAIDVPRQACTIIEGKHREEVHRHPKAEHAQLRLSQIVIAYTVGIKA